MSSAGPVGFTPTWTRTTTYSIVSTESHPSMARVPTRKTLEGMKRADIQQLCKVSLSLELTAWFEREYAQDHSVRANLKTEALIDLLLNSTK